MGLSILIVTKVDNGGLPICHKFIEDGIAYNELWDVRVELLISDKVKKGEIKKSKIGKGKINSSEVKEV